MQNILTGLITVQALAKEVHWNMQGPGFISVHSYLDGVDDSCVEYIDVIGEHMVATMNYGLPQWGIRPFETFPQLMIRNRTPADGLQAVVPEIESLVDELEEFLANTNDDPAGQDYATQCLQEFNHHLWVLSSELG